MCSREGIIQTIKSVGLSVDEFIIGCGAISSKSMINYNPDLKCEEYKISILENAPEAVIKRQHIKNYFKYG